MNKLTKQQFIDRAIKIHGKKYDYSESVYIGYHHKLEIRCPEHGLFSKSPSDHCSNKQGCKICSTNKSAFMRRLTKQNFIFKAKTIHADRYDYSKIKYQNRSTKVNIICKEHGEFLQMPYAHLKGQNCPRCKYDNKMENAWLDSLNLDDLNRQYRVPKTLYRVDGYHFKTNTIYEFLGDYWHSNIGHCRIFPDENHPSRSSKQKNKFITHSQNYLWTLKRLNHLKSMGYNVVYIWESDWIN